MDAEATHLVRRGRDHATPRLSADDERLSAERRIVPLLDGRVERVHVDVEDLAHGREPQFVTVASPIVTDPERSWKFPVCDSVTSFTEQPLIAPVIATLPPPVTPLMKA